MNIRKDYYPDDIAKTLVYLSGAETTEYETELKKDLEDALYQLMAISENEYNFDFYRTLWNTLQDICSRDCVGVFDDPFAIPFN